MKVKFWGPDKRTLFSTQPLNHRPGVVKREPHRDGHKGREYQNEFPDPLQQGGLKSGMSIEDIGLVENQGYGGNPQSKNQKESHIDPKIIYNPDHGDGQ